MLGAVKLASCAYGMQHAVATMSACVLCACCLCAQVLHGRVQVRTPNQAPFEPIPDLHPPLHTPSHSTTTKSTSSISGCHPGAAAAAVAAAAVTSGTGSGGELSRGVPGGAGGGARVSVGGVRGGAGLRGVCEEDIRALFESIDVDRSGAIDAEELQVALEMVGVVMGTAEVRGRLALPGLL